MAKLANLARMTTATVGTGTITLGSNVPGFKTFAQAGVVNGDTVSYAISDGANSECGRGVYTSSGTTLTRSVLSSTNSDAAISLSGTALVSVTALAEDFAASGPPVTPQGRLALTTGTPIGTGVTGGTTVFYTPYVGQFVPLYDGATFVNTDTGGELSQATTDTTKSPAAVTTNSNYDVFVWSDSGTIRATRGPAWTSDTGRGTGAGTTELVRVNGIWLNANAITNGPAAQRGTYVGTFRSNASSTIDFNLGASAAGGTAALISVWNCYNRVMVGAAPRDSTDSWTLASASIRAANNSNAMRVSFVIGINEDNWEATYTAACKPGSGGHATIGVALDSTSAFNGGTANNDGATSQLLLGLQSRYVNTGGVLGWHFFQAMEASQVAGTATFYGDNGAPTYTRNALQVTGRF